jgi:hypothetical protein
VAIRVPASLAKGCAIPLELGRPKRPQDLRFSQRYQLPAGALVSYAVQNPQGLRESKYDGDAALVDLSIGGCKLRTDANLARSIYYDLILHSPSYPRPIAIDRARFGGWRTRCSACGLRISICRTSNISIRSCSNYISVARFSKSRVPCDAAGGASAYQSEKSARGSQRRFGLVPCIVRPTAYGSPAMRRVVLSVRTARGGYE